MNIILIISLSISLANSATICAGLIESSCIVLNHCQYINGSCMVKQCYQLDDVSICRSGGEAFASCNEVNNLPQLSNVCKSNVFSYLQADFYTYKSDNPTSTSISTSNDILITTLINTATPCNRLMFDLYTVNVMKANEVELKNILDAYQHFQRELIGSMSHPYYLEKLMAETLCRIRDIQFVSNNSKKTVLNKFFRILEIYFVRLNYFTTLAHSTSYLLINFGMAPTNQYKLEVYGLNQKWTIQWTTYSSSSYFNVISMPVRQFGFIGFISDVLMIKPVKQIDNLVSPIYYTVKWEWTSPLIVSPTTDVRLYSLDIVNRVQTFWNKVVTVSGSSFTVSLGYANDIVFSLGPVADQVCTGRNQFDCQVMVGSYATGSCVCP